MQCGFLNIVNMSFPRSRNLLYLLFVTRKVQHVEAGTVYLSDARSSLLHYKSLYINIYLVNNQSSHVLQPLEMHKEELGRHENVGFVTTKMCLLFFQNLQKRLLTCKRA
jgi:hypothetical protein